jgi:16S rRNA (guanine527-N7)-methyltransferase
MIPTETASLLQQFGVSRESLEKLRVYVDTLISWQRRINLIGPSTTENVWTRHIVDAVQLLPLLPPNTRVIADLGSGAGIPGLVLAIAGNFEANLYESNGKKVAFLRQATRLTGEKITVHQVRLEEVAKTSPPAVDVVVARALAPLTLLLDYAEPFLNSGARALFHKGQDIDIELTAATKYWNMQFSKHPSATDSRGCILEVKEAYRVREQLNPIR